MKARDTERVATLRMAISAMNYRRIERTGNLTDDEMLDVLRKQVRQRDDSIEAYTKAGRPDLAAKETRERTILNEYLPASMNEDDLRAAVREIVVGLGASPNMGAAMKAAMPALKDRATGKAIQAAVKAELEARGKP
jgi:uncharacterized protein YqeY